MHVYKREGKRGTVWYVRVDLPPDPITGKRRQKRVSAPTKRECQQAARKLMHEVETGRFVEPTSMTVREYLQFWLDTYAQHNVRATTFRSYEQMIRLHLVPAIGGIGLQKLQPAHLQGFYSEKLEGGRADGKEGGLSARTVLTLHRIIREALQQAMKWGMVHRNVADATDPPKPQRKPPKVWNHQQVKAFLNYVESTGDRFNPLWHLALSTGMRRGELLGLRWEDVDFDHGVLRIRQNLVEVNGRIYFQEPKTKSGRRAVVLLEGTVNRLRDHQRRQDVRRSQLGEAWVEHGLVFTNEIGGPIFPAHVNRHFRPLVRKAGLPNITFHGLRHTHATLLLREGVHLKIASERLGHSNIVLTADTYSHVLPDMQRHALDLIDASVFDAE